MIPTALGGDSRGMQRCPHGRRGDGAYGYEDLASHQPHITTPGTGANHQANKPLAPTGPDHVELAIDVPLRTIPITEASASAFGCSGQWNRRSPMNKRRKLMPLRYVLILCAAAVGFSPSVQAQRSTSTRPQTVQQPGTERSGAFSPEPYCPAPQKFATGACVPRRVRGPGPLLPDAEQLRPVPLAGRARGFS